jgi:hypothetical protein
LALASCTFQMAVLVWSWVEHQTQSPTLVLNRQLTLWTFTILNWKYSMCVCSSLYRYDICFCFWRFVLFFLYLFVCFFCLVFVLIFIQDLDWEPNSIDVYVFNPNSF